MITSVRAIDQISRPSFAAEVSGIDITKPLSRQDTVAVASHLDHYGVLVFRDQRLDDGTQLEFSRNFGTLEEAAQSANRRLSVNMVDVSNLNKSNQIMARDDLQRINLFGNQLWHSDSSYKAAPAKYSLLSARQIPGAGGNTEFADMRAAYDTLDYDTKAACENLICEHSQLFSRGFLGVSDFTEDERRQFTPVQQRLVRRHPVTGRKSLFLSAHAGVILGWSILESRAFLRDLMEHATQREFVYAHVWKQWDLLMWDNRITMHRARPFKSDQVRDLRRTTVACEKSTMEEAA